MKGEKLLIVGSPGSGKTTLVSRLAEELAALGFTVGGFVSPEKRVGGRRVAFLIKDLSSGRTTQLASLASAWKGENELRVGRYVVHLEQFERFVLPILDKALSYQVFLIDEIGKMELFSKKFEEKVVEVLLAEELHVISTVGMKFIDKFREYGEVLELTPRNRDELFFQIRQKFADLV